jgi:DNA mismatch repair ATPase MutS
VKRLRLLVDLTQAGGLLFLADELLAGTNSHDRRVGAEAVVRALIERGALGLVTTHDLALAELAPHLGGANVHFEDLVREGDGQDASAALHFDYTLRDGPIDPHRTNALKLMRAVGLPVDAA